MKTPTLMQRFLLILLVFAAIRSAGQVAVTTDGSLPDNSAMLDVKSTARGVLVPRMTTVQRTAIPTPAPGLLVYDTTTATFWFYNGTSWINLGSSSSSGSAWSLTGNSGTTPGTNFIGTTDAQDLYFKVGNNPAGRIERPYGTMNTGLGYKSFSSNLTGHWCTALGYMALSSMKTGQGNTALGFQAMLLDSAGSQNTAIGANALLFSGEGSMNTAIGYQAAMNSSGHNNTAIGNFALFGALNGYNNTVVGSNSLSSDQSGSMNTAIGFQTLKGNTDGHFNTAVGNEALFSNTTAIGNVAVGNMTLHANTTGNNNTANGSGSLLSNQTGSSNTACGNDALYSNVTGFSNIAVGVRALYHSTQKSNQIAIGDSALFNNGITGGIYDGIYNTAIGSKAMLSNTTGTYNTALGALAQYSLASGTGNTGIGYWSNYACISGSRNTAVGTISLESNLYGSDNTAIGYNADVQFNNLTNATAIGANAMVSASNSLVLGSGANVGIGISNPAAKLHLQVSGFDAYSGVMITSTIPGGKSLSVNQGAPGKLNFTNPGIIDLVTMDFNNNRVGIWSSFPTHLLQLGMDDAFKPATSTWGVLSDMRVKENIRPFTDGWNVLKEIHPVWFTYNGEAGTRKGETAVGTIAQEMKKVAPYMVTETTYGGSGNADTSYLGVNYHALFFILANTAREQQETITGLRMEIDQLEKRIVALEKGR